MVGKISKDKELEKRCERIVSEVIADSKKRRKKKGKESG